MNKPKIARGNKYHTVIKAITKEWPRNINVTLITIFKCIDMVEKKIWALGWRIRFLLIDVITN